MHCHLFEESCPERYTWRCQAKGVTVTQREQVAVLLIDVEAHLRQLGLWQSQPPGADALASTQPFCVDTLEFDQWLQFVFLPTMQELLETGQALPGECGIAPMAEEFCRLRKLPGVPLERVLAALDRVLSD